MSNTVPAHPHPEPTMPILPLGVLGAHAIESERGEASVVAPLLLQELDGR